MQLLDELKFILWSLYRFVPNALLLFLQKRKLKKLLEYARTNIPHYGGLTVDDVNASSNSLEFLPILTRRTVKESGKKMVNYHLPKWMYENRGGTSGSTGEPLQFYGSVFTTKFLETRLKYVYSFLFRPFIAKGYSVYNILHKMKIAEVREPNEVEVKRSKADNHSSHLFLNQQLLQSGPKELVDKIISFKPDIFGCYATYTLAFCRLVEKYGYKGKVTIPFIINSGESLLPGQKKYIEETLGGKVYNRYGTGEFGPIACEIDGVEGYVAFAETYIIEIVDDENKSVALGEVGRVLVTDLTNYTQPFIRYEVGDLAQLLEKNGPYVRFNLQGRDKHVLFGTKKLGHFDLNSLFADHAEAITQYQIIKKSENNIEVRIVKNALYLDFMTEDIVRAIQAVVGDTVKVEVTFHESLQRIGRGKTPVYLDETGNQ